LASFNYIHISDTHLCIQPGRRNVLYLVQRNVRRNIDTIFQQAQGIGFASVLRPASYVPEIVAGAAQFCIEREAIVDGLIFTGDLATTGIATDINVAYSFITTPPTGGFYSSPRTPTLAFLPPDIMHVLPGNHDKFDDDFGTPNGRNFELRFGTMPNFSRGVGHWIDEKQGQYLGFLSADFTLRARGDAADKVVGAYGQGRVYQDVLDELVARSLQLRTQLPNIFLVWVIHFAPYECGYDIRLLDFDQVIEAAIRLKIVATLCGHTHKSFKMTIDQHIIYCSGSAGSIDKEDDSRIHMLYFNINDTCHVERENFIWDRDQREFMYFSRD
jgi:3',5'-cyclic AMP phosphodiesterase CpdA